MSYCCVCGRKADHLKSFHCVIENDTYHYCHIHSFIGEKLHDKYYKTQSKNLCYKHKNPHPKYSYNTGLKTEDGKRVWGIDNKWLMFEIKHGNGLPSLD